MRQRFTKWGAILALAVFTGLTLALTVQCRAAALTDGIAPMYKTAAEFPARMGAAVIYRGALVAVSNGIAYPAQEAEDWRVIGVASETVDNRTTATGYSATRRCTVRQGIFAFANQQTGTDASTNAVYAIAVSDVGKPAYVVDDQTVSASSNAYHTVAGTVVYVEPATSYVWIDVGKAWAETAELLPYSLPTSTNGLTKGRLYVYPSLGTNTVGIVD